MNRFRPTALLLVMVLPLLASCSTGLVDPSYAAHEAKALHSPSANAITGLWTSDNEISLLPGQHANRRFVTVFRPDGTGYFRFHFQTSDRALLVVERSHEHATQSIPLTWHYDGNGVWSVTLSKKVGRLPVKQTIRTDGSVLLCRFDGGRDDRIVYHLVKRDF